MATGDKKYVIMQTDRGKADSYGFAPQTQIADVEASTTAAQAYAIGDYFVLNGYFYRATAAISIGDTISPGSGSGNNCVATNIAAELVARQVEITNTTPTNLTGILNGNGSTVGVAAAGTDYQAPLTAGTDYATPAAVTATQQDIAYVLADPAGVNVASGLYVIYNNALYKTTAAISSSEAASSFTSKLTAVTGGIGNELKSAIPSFSDIIQYLLSAPSEDALTLNSSYDMDNIKTAGVYHQGGSSSPAHNPSSTFSGENVNNALIYVLKRTADEAYSADMYFQFWLSLNSGKIYYRCMNPFNLAWFAWTKLN